MIAPVRYTFVTTWRLDAPIERVWEALAKPDDWNAAWPYVEHVTELVPGDQNGLGSVHRYVYRTALPYTLTIDLRVTRMERPHLLEVAASGELEGTGTWELKSQHGVTTTSYTWSVATTRPWMNLLAPLARPFFAWNHAVVMRSGGEALARVLGARLLPEVAPPPPPRWQRGVAAAYLTVVALYALLVVCLRWRLQARKHRR